MWQSQSRVGSWQGWPLGVVNAVRPKEGSCGGVQGESKGVRSLAGERRESKEGTKNAAGGGGEQEWTRHTSVQGAKRSEGKRRRGRNGVGAREQQEQLSWRLRRRGAKGSVSEAKFQVYAEA